GTRSETTADSTRKTAGAGTCRRWASRLDPTASTPVAATSRTTWAKGTRSSIVVLRGGRLVCRPDFPAHPSPTLPPRESDLGRGRRGARGADLARCARPTWPRADRVLDVAVQDPTARRGRDDRRAVLSRAAHRRTARGGPRPAGPGRRHRGARRG